MPPKRPKIHSPCGKLPNDCLVSIVITLKSCRGFTLQFDPNRLDHFSPSVLDSNDPQRHDLGKQLHEPPLSNDFGRQPGPVGISRMHNEHLRTHIGLHGSLETAGDQLTTAPKGARQLEIPCVIPETPAREPRCTASSSYATCRPSKASVSGQSGAGRAETLRIAQPWLRDETTSHQAAVRHPGASRYLPLSARTRWGRPDAGFAETGRTFTQLSLRVKAAPDPLRPLEPRA